MSPAHGCPGPAGPFLPGQAPAAPVPRTGARRGHSQRPQPRGHKTPQAEPERDPGRGVSSQGCVRGSGRKCGPSRGEQVARSLLRLRPSGAASQAILEPVGHENHPLPLWLGVQAPGPMPRAEQPESGHLSAHASPARAGTGAAPFRRALRGQQH